MAEASSVSADAPCAWRAAACWAISWLSRRCRTARRRDQYGLALLELRLLLVERPDRARVGRDEQLVANLGERGRGGVDQILGREHLGLGGLQGQGRGSCG